MFLFSFVALHSSVQECQNRIQEITEKFQRKTEEFRKRELDLLDEIKKNLNLLDKIKEEKSELKVLSGGYQNDITRLEGLLRAKEILLKSLEETIKKKDDKNQNLMFENQLKMNEMITSNKNHHDEIERSKKEIIDKFGIREEALKNEFQLNLKHSLELSKRNEDEMTRKIIDNKSFTQDIINDLNRKLKDDINISKNSVDEWKRKSEITDVTFKMKIKEANDRLHDSEENGKNILRGTYVQTSLIISAFRIFCFLFSVLIFHLSISVSPVFLFVF